MAQLTYNEAFDPYHAAFRFLRLNMACDISIECPFDKFRILDFYMLFPFRLQQMRLLDQDKGWRRISKLYDKKAPYGLLPDDSLLFSRMEPFQRAAATSLCQSGHLSLEAWDRNQIAFTNIPLPSAILQRCQTMNDNMSDIVSVLCKLMRNYPLNGRDGLKDRTGLLEYRYDPI